MADNSDLEALQNKVSKLNSILAIYKETFGSLSTDPETDDNAPEVPWFVDKKLLSTFINDYDNMIEELQQQRNAEESDVKYLITLVKNLTEENKRLKFQLTQRQTYKDDDDGEEDNDSSQESSHFHTDHSRSTTHELEEAKLKAEKKLMETQAELASCKWQIKELRSTLDQLRTSDVSKEPGTAVASSLMGGPLHGSALNAHIEQLKQLLRNYETRINGKSDQVSGLEEERMQLAKQMEKLKLKADELEQRDIQNLQQMIRNKKLAEDALAERDQCLMRERQAQEEVSRLQDLIQKVIEKAGMKSREEVERIKTEQKMKQRKLEFQLQKFREENTEIKTLLDRVKREKVSLQDELRSVSERLEESEGTKILSRDDLTARMFNAERSRDETALKLSLLEDKVASAEMQHKKEMERLTEELKQAKERLSRCMTEFDRVTDDREKSVSEVFNLKNVMSKLECNKDASMRYLSKQLLAFQQLLKTKEKEYETRLIAIEDEHRNSLMSLKESLAGQQRIASKLKEETNSMIKNLESTIAILRGELISEKKDKTEALKLLKDSKAKTKETEMRLAAFSKNIEILESRLFNSEIRESASQNMAKRRNNMIQGLSVADARRSEVRDIEQYLRESNR